MGFGRFVNYGLCQTQTFLVSQRRRNKINETLPIASSEVAVFRNFTCNWIYLFMKKLVVEITFNKYLETGTKLRYIDNGMALKLIVYT